MDLDEKKSEVFKQCACWSLVGLCALLIVHSKIVIIFFFLFVCLKVRSGRKVDF